MKTILSRILATLVGLAVAGCFGWLLVGTTVTWKQPLTRYEVLYLVLTALGATAVVMTFVIYWRMLRSMQHSNSAQSILALVNYLQNEDIQDARRLVLEELAERPLADWTQPQRRAAARVCSSYDVAAILVSRGYVALEFLADNYAPSILRCFAILQPFITELRRSDAAGAQIGTRWSSFEWLHAQAQARRGAAEAGR